MIGRAVEALDRVSRASDLNCAPSIKRGNEENHAIGLGAMNLHGFLATHHIYYDTPEAVDFTDMFFYATAYYAFKASHYMAMKKVRSPDLRIPNMRTVHISKSTPKN